MSLESAFDPEEWAALSGPLRLRTYEARDPHRSLEPHALLDGSHCLELLDALTPMIGSPSRRVTASLLGKRLSFLLTGASLYALSAFDKGLTVSLDNVLIEYGHDGAVWTSCLPLRRLETNGPEPGKREVWRRSLATSLFAGTVYPLWECLHAATGLSRRILWENTAVRVYSLYERRLAALGSDEARQRCQRDFQWLVTSAPGDVFGLDHNPLQRFYFPRTPMPESAAVRFRRTCCLYYQATEPVEYCSTCPLIRPARG